MSIYFIRHGQSVFNATFDPLVGDPLIFDSPLSPLGREQALAARSQIANLGIERVIASPLTRAIETALHIFAGGPNIEVDPRARELLSNSCDVGRAPADLATDFPQLRFGHISDHWWHQGAANEHGVAHESMNVFVDRVIEFRDWLIAEADRKSETIAVVAHGNLFKAMIGRLLENCEIHDYKSDKLEIFSITQ